MKKDRSHIIEMLSNTIPIDTWILENITFNINSWKQKVPIGSRLIHTYKHHSFDAIDYYDDPSCDGSPKFRIEYCVTDIRVTTDPTRERNSPNDRSLVLLYDEPNFFTSLEAWIWNIRTIDYIVSNLQSIVGNIELFKDHLLDKQDLATKMSCYVQQLHTKIDKIDDIIRDEVRKLVNGKELIYPAINGIIIKDFAGPQSDL